MFDRHFSKKVIRNLAKKGIFIIGLTAIPDMTSSMPYANADTGYQLNDNGTHRIRTYFEVIAMAEAN